MGENFQGTFTSEKISRIKWKREDFNEAQSFISGSWDNPINKITHWTFRKDNFGEGEDDELADLYPAVISSYPFNGDVTELEFVSKDSFVASSSLGFVRLLEIQDNPNVGFKELVCWDSIHKFETQEKAACTALATFKPDIVTVGEDGRINLLTANEKKPVRTIEKGDSCSLLCVDFLRHYEILSGNLRGHMKLWDLRNKNDCPATTFMLSERSKTEATSIAHHPTQRHMVVAGGGDGSLTVWDLRRNTYPISQLNAHAQSVTRVLFHPDRPDNLFTSSISGELWHWKSAQSSKLVLENSDTHWLNTVGTNGRVNVSALCGSMHKPINTIDIDRSTLLFGSDNEAMYVLRNVGL